MRSSSINSPYGCPHNEFICDYTHLTISRAMSFIRCSHLAVARAMSSPPDTSHLAAFLRDELVFRHPVSRSCPRDPVVFSDYTCSGRPRSCVRSATVTDLVSQTDDFRFATHSSDSVSQTGDESRRIHSNSGYPKPELVPRLTRFLGCPTNRARFATASHLVAQMPARSATLFPGGLPLEKPAEDAFPPLGCPHDEEHLGTHSPAGCPVDEFARRTHIPVAWPMSLPRNDLTP